MSFHFLKQILSHPESSTRAQTAMVTEYSNIVISPKHCFIILTLSATVAQQVTQSPRNTEDVGSNPGTGRHTLAQMTT